VGRWRARLRPRCSSTASRWSGDSQRRMRGGEVNSVAGPPARAMMRGRGGSGRVHCTVRCIRWTSGQQQHQDSSAPCWAATACAHISTPTPSHAGCNRYIALAATLASSLPQAAVAAVVRCWSSRLLRATLQCAPNHAACPPPARPAASESPRLA
jgi:hypothetical protein